VSALAGLIMLFVMPCLVPARAADDRPTVVELFTSQGCGSCVTADAYLHSLAKRDDVIALTFPVTYWDYLGWKDTLARPEFDERQRAFAPLPQAPTSIRRRSSSTAFTARWLRSRMSLTG